MLGGLLALGLFYWAATRHAQQVNLDVTSYDQNGYLYYGRLLHETDYQYVGDRNRMPLYPFLLSLIYQSRWSEEQFFTAGKTFNVILSAVLLIGLFFILKKFLSLFSAINLWLITAFTVFLFKAPYVQAENLFYFLNFLLFLTLLRLFSKPGWIAAIAAGVLFGLAHLTKASVLPELLAFLVVGGSKMTYEAWQRRKTGSMQTVPLLRAVAQWGMVLLLFLLIVSPYLANSKKIFGQYFYNVNSTFYFWCETVEEWKSGPKAHGDRFGWPDLTPEQTPSAGNYLAKHGVAHLVHRLYRGGRTLWTTCRTSFGFFNYLLIYSFFLVVVALLNRRQLVQWIKKHIFLFLFVVVLFFGYGLLMAWWNYLGPQVRHVLAFFLPFAFVCVRLVEKLPVQSWSLGVHRSINLTTAFNVALAIYLVFDLAQILTVRIVTISAGI